MNWEYATWEGKAVLYEFVRGLDYQGRGVAHFSLDVAAATLHRSPSTIKRYLKWGKEIGLFRHYEVRYLSCWPDLARLTKELVANRCCFPGCRNEGRETHHAFYLGWVYLYRFVDRAPTDDEWRRCPIWSNLQRQLQNL